MKKETKPNKKEIDINHELGEMIISTKLFNKKTIEYGKGEADVIIDDFEGKKWFFEIKQSSWPKGIFFDAATLTQWNAWYQNKDRYLFVFITGSKNERLFSFVRAEDLMQHSTIPPFKIYFNMYKDEVEDIFVSKKNFINQIKSVVGNKNCLSKLKEHNYKRKSSNKRDNKSIALYDELIRILQEFYEGLRGEK